MNKEQRDALYEELDGVMDDLLKIEEIHSKTDCSIINETTDEEQRIINIVESLIGRGLTELYPMLALLVSTNNWHTYIIVRISFFKMYIKEGIEKGCLEPDKELAWAWIDTAAENNDPNEFFDEVDDLYDILATATEEGSDEVHNIARDIINRIWEPEDIIEED